MANKTQAGKVSDKLVVKFGDKVREAAGSDDTSDIKWSTIVNAMAEYAKKNTRKMSSDEIREAITVSINRVTDNGVSKLSPGILDEGIDLAMAIQDEIFKTKCWGVCASKTKK